MINSFYNQETHENYQWSVNIKYYIFDQSNWYIINSVIINQQRVIFV